MANRREKRRNLGFGGSYIMHMGFFDLLVFKAIWGSFGTLVSKWLVT